MGAELGVGEDFLPARGMTQGLPVLHSMSLHSVGTELGGGGTPLPKAGVLVPQARQQP